MSLNIDIPPWLFAAAMILWTISIVLDGIKLWLDRKIRKLEQEIKGL